ncbi:MAG: hypothetical protein K2X87_11260 [Gemmataceae bacterium]|nr:hypothetical protein [Gemmataceae bacterium]
MRTRMIAGLAAVAAGVGLAGGQPKDPGPGLTTKLLYGHDLKVRPGGEKGFGKAKTVSVEAVRVEVAEGDGPARKTTPFVVVASDAGFLAAFPDGPVGQDRRSHRQAGFDLRPRPAGEPEVTQGTKAWGVELFRDLGTNRLLYVTEAGAVASAPVPAALAADRGPARLYGVNLRVRAPGEEGFDKAKKFGVDVFRDDNTGGLVYAAETGSIAAAPVPAVPAPKQVAAPRSAYGLDLLVRAADQTGFDQAKPVPVEVYEDPNANALVYVSGSGSVAVAPNPGKLADLADRPPVWWLGGLNLKVRVPNGKDAVKTFGAEVYRDARTGNLLLVSETGAVAVLPKP